MYSTIINGQKHSGLQKNRNLKFLTKNETWYCIPSILIPFSIVIVSIAVNFNLYTDNRVWPLIFMKTTACQNEIPKDFLLLTQETRLQFFLSPFKRQRLRQMISTLSPSEHKVFSLYSVTELQLKGTSYCGIFCKHLFIWKKWKGKKNQNKTERNPPNCLLAIMVITCSHEHLGSAMNAWYWDKCLHSTLTLPSSHSVPQEFIWGCTLNSKEQKLYQWSQQFTKLHLKQLHLKCNPGLDLFN